ncbi:SecDF P1 head subdomain-containing protein [Lysobacter enzymogenes]|uniref:SecDF P1 head subdomain-containing protein n=1 Tax=Lysobacter enzymogenes TaxID=69 RepID=UPI00384D8EEA
MLAATAVLMWAMAAALGAAGCARSPDASGGGEAVRGDVAFYLVDEGAVEGARTVPVLRPYPGQPPRLALQSVPAVARGQIVRVALRSEENGGASLQLTLSADGAKRLGQATRDNVGKRMAVVVGAVAVNVATIQSEISGGSLQVSGLSRAEALALHRELVQGR